MNSNQSLVKNSLYNVAYKLLNVIFPLVSATYIARVIFAKGVGEVSYAQNIVSYFTTIAALGIPNYGIREIAKARKSKQQTDEIFFELFTINAVSTTVCIVAYFMLIHFVSALNSNIKMYYAVGLLLIFNYINVDWFYQGNEEYGYIAKRSFVIKLISLIAMFVFVRRPEDIIPYCIISVLATNGGNLINVFYVRKYAKIRFTFNMDLKRHLLPLLILFVNSIAITIYVNSDITMLGFFESDAQVGVYSFASKIYNLLKQLINAVIVVSVPRIAYILKNKHEEYKMFINRIFSALNIILLPIIVGMFCMSDSMILLAGGEQYISGDVALKILSVATLFAIYASLFTNCVLIVNRQEKYCLNATVVSAIVNVGLNFVLMPWLGMIGAAITTVLAEFVNCVMQIHFSKPFFNWRTLEIKPVMSCVCGSVAIGVICMICNWNFDSSLLRMISAVLISVVIYAGILIFMKNPYAQDTIEIIKKKFGKRKES